MHIKAKQIRAMQKTRLLFSNPPWLMTMIKSLLLTVSLLFVVIVLAQPRLAMATIDVYSFDSVQQEQEYRALIHELRCPKCQNQSLASSNSPIAEDLKQQIYEMLRAGKSDTEIRQYMLQRYGDFISYKPPVRPATYVLWFLPPLLLCLAIVIWLRRTHQSAYRQTQKVTAQHDKGSEVQINHNENDENELEDGVFSAELNSQLTETEQVKLAKLLSISSDQQAVDTVFNPQPKSTKE